MTANNTIKEKLDAFAVTIVDKAGGENVTFADKLDAFKALTAYYVGVNKVMFKPVKDKPPEGDTGDFSFENMKNDIENAGEETDLA